MLAIGPLSSNRIRSIRSSLASQAAENRCTGLCPLLKRGDLRIIAETRTTEAGDSSTRRRACSASCVTEQTPSSSLPPTPRTKRLTGQMDRRTASGLVGGH
jgi:hypothetical protein